MKILTLLTVAVLTLGLGIGIAQADETPKTYTPEQIKEMPRFSHTENRRCPKSRYPLLKKRLECKHEVRVELFEKRQAREAAEQNND